MACAVVLIPARTRAQSPIPCRIEVVDKQNGWPVPLVKLRTTHNVALVTDNAGVIAVDQPELLDREVWFHVASPGYGVPKDGFGYRGVRLTPKSGETLRVEVGRTSIAKRLGRLTGAGIFGESQQLGERSDWQESGSFGCDTIQLAAHRGRLHWLWGDTTLAHYPLGVFASTSATTDLRPLKKLEPPIALRYKYFTNEKGIPRGVANISGDGPTWLSAMVSVPDENGNDRLIATYSKIRGFLEAYEIGLCAWNDETESFERLRKLWTKSEATPKPPLYPDGHVTLWKDEAGGEWLLFGNPFPTLRCPATFEAWQDAGQWEQLAPQERVRSAADGKEIDPHSGSIAWNSFRRRWVTVFQEMGGKPSMLGELWYAEADAPTGPWGPAVKVLSHDNYTFYNVRLHPELNDAESPILLFEGTYTTFLVDKPIPTPRYDYNQILYRLDLDDPALRAASPPKP
jgi:hypothetical protein